MEIVKSLKSFDSSSPFETLIKINRFSSLILVAVDFIVRITSLDSVTVTHQSFGET